MNRKLLIVLMTVIASVALVATAFAGHMVKEGFEYVPEVVKSKKASINLSGQIRIRGEIADSLKDFEEDDTLGKVSPSDDTSSGNNERVRLKLDVTVSPNTKGVIELETGADSGSSYTWGGTGCEGSRGSSSVIAGDPTTEGNCKPTDMHLRQGYIAHQGSGLLGMQAGFKAGHQLVGVGNNLFYNHTEYGDDALVFWMNPMDATELSLTIAKLDENSGHGADDITLVSLSGTTTMDGIDLGANVSLINDNSMSGMHTDLWNIGLLGDMEISGINIYADVEFQFGEIENGAGVLGDVDFGGYAFQLGADTKVGDFTVGAEFAYGSGDDDPLDTDIDLFVNYLSTGQKFTYIYDNKACTSVGLSTTSCFTDTGLANTWYINVNASSNFTPDLKGQFDVYYLQAAEEIHPVLDDKDIGIELNAKLTYQLDNNIVLYLENGVLFAGDLYKNRTTLADDPEDPFSSRAGLLLNF